MKKLTKVLISVVAAMAMCFAVVACGGDPSNVPAQSGTPGTGTTGTPETPDTPSTPVTYTVTYDLDGGEGTLPTESAKQAGAKFNLASGDGLTKTDFTFDGWSDGTDSYAAGAEYTMPASNVTLTAQWAALEPHALTYVLGDDVIAADGDLEDVAPQGGEYLPGAKVTLPLAVSFGVEDKVFGGWNDGVNTYPMGYEYTMPAKAVTFTAVWNDPLSESDVLGKWTNADGDEFDLMAYESEELYTTNIGLLNGKVVSYSDNMLFTLDYSEYWLVTGTPDAIMLTLIGEDEEGNDFSAVLDNVILTQKNDLVNAEMTEFIGRWKRADYNQPWLITDTGAYYGLSLNEATYFTLGSKLIMYYEFTGEYYFYVMEKNGDSLTGGWLAPYNDVLVGVTFEQATFVTLTVEGKLNQAVNNGATPDESKIVAPAAPSGQEFDKWVLAGTDTEFDPKAVMTEDASITAVFKTPDASAQKTYVGELTIGSGLFATKCTKIVVDEDGLKAVYTLNGNDSEVNITSVSANAYKINLNGEDYWIELTADNTLRIYDYNTMDDEDLVATFTLEE